MKFLSLIQKVDIINVFNVIFSFLPFLSLMLGATNVTEIHNVQATYTVGGQSFTAADIEFIILKMKPPAHRPQIVCIHYQIYAVGGNSFTGNVDEEC